MILPPSLSPEKQALLERIVGLLANVDGVRAVVLGGSYARGTQNAGSDLDVAMYYREDAPFRIEDIRAIAAQLAAGSAPDVTGFYGWGPWVNGGAWIHTPVCKVDFLYRNLGQVQRTITEACQGITQHDYDQQPAFGFYSVIYLAETRVCLPLYDPAGELARLKAQVAVYPPQLKEKGVASSLWAAEFALIHCAGYAAKGDVYATCGSLARASAALTQALFALNETYFMTDKTALAELRGFSRVPPAYTARLSGVLAAPGQTPAELSAATEALRGLWSEVVALTGGSYRPAFNL
jgi:predicted nucleotidyltransferase